MKIKNINKGFTLIEVLLVITLIGVLLTIGLVSFNTEARFIEVRNDTRRNHIQSLESAVNQYKLQEGSYPTGLSRNYQEICDPDATNCNGFVDLNQFLVPKYLQSIPKDPNDADTTGGTGYSVAVDETTNTVGVRALQAEGGETIAINDPLPAETTVTANTPLASTVPVTPPWTPSQITTALWLDAADASTFTFSSGTTVNNWTSKSGGYVLTQSDNAKRPSRSGSVNGLPAVVFDGGDGMSVANFDHRSAGQQASFFAVFTASSGGDQFLLEHTADTNVNSGAFNLARNSTNQVGFTKYSAGPVRYATFETTGTVTTLPKVFVGTMNGTLSTNENFGWLDGDGAGGRFSNQDTNANFLNATLFLGSRNNTSLFLNGQICEVGIIPSVVSTDTRQRIEGYLAWKWGLEANLPAGHPYENSAPTL